MHDGEFLAKTFLWPKNARARAFRVFLAAVLKTVSFPHSGNKRLEVITRTDLLMRWCPFDEAVTRGETK